jgi:hypothetical protein
MEQQQEVLSVEQIDSKAKQYGGEISNFLVTNKIFEFAARRIALDTFFPLQTPTVDKGYGFTLRKTDGEGNYVFKLNSRAPFSMTVESHKVLGQSDGIEESITLSGSSPSEKDFGKISYMGSDEEGNDIILQNTSAVPKIEEFITRLKHDLTPNPQE